jgi:hypothetical protein
MGTEFIDMLSPCSAASLVSDVGSRSILNYDLTGTAVSIAKNFIYRSLKPCLRRFYMLLN